jgi:hypothetical protein
MTRTLKVVKETTYLKIIELSLAGAGEIMKRRGLLICH